MRLFISRELERPGHAPQSTHNDKESRSILHCYQLPSSPFCVCTLTIQACANIDDLEVRVLADQPEDSRARALLCCYSSAASASAFKASSFYLHFMLASARSFRFLLRVRLNTTWSGTSSFAALRLVCLHDAA
jgi:hypothetical protein